MRNVARLAVATVLLFCVGTTGAQFITNGTLNDNTNGWQLSSGCGDDAV
ncbi:MAG: hypothetical protein ABI440_12495 [Casimicrobiaceae bacterium]